MNEQNKVSKKVRKCRKIGQNQRPKPHLSKKYASAHRGKSCLTELRDFQNRRFDTTFHRMSTPEELSPEESLRADNELRALGLETRYGANTFISDDAPPELISEWLKNVAAFEEQNQGGPKTTVHAYIGSPAYAAPDVLEKSTLPLEIGRLEQALEANGIVVRRPDGLDDQRFYRFLVEEILPHEHPDIRAEGAVYIYDYEEFHPNTAEVVRQYAQAQIIELLHLGQPFEGLLLSENLRGETERLTRQQVMQTVRTFRARYSQIIPVGFSPDRMMGDESAMYFLFGVRWEGIPADGGEREVHEGIGVVQLACEHGEWRVQGVQMPGFQF
jgi:hypothetical protein